MFIHTILYNELYDKDKIIQQFKKINGCELILWEYKSILDFFSNKYNQYTNYYKRLILNKSRENFAKYFIIQEFGGMFININIITNHLNELEQLGDFFHKNTHNHMIFFYDLIKQCDFTNDIFNIYDKIICDDIFTITNKSNSFINYLISNIDTKIIPTNEYENKTYQNLWNI